MDQNGEMKQVYCIKYHQNQHQFVGNLKQLSFEALSNCKNKIIHMSRSKYHQLVTHHQHSQQNFIDHQFPPNQKSLGDIQKQDYFTWKRIPQLIHQPILFNNIQPQSVLQGKIGDCYFLSAVSALAEDETHIFNIFDRQTYNPKGIYYIQLQIDGIIQQIVVDDYIPVNQKSEPIFSNFLKNEFWVSILEKAWAKAHGSYANIISGNPAEVFKAFTHAPTESILIELQPQGMQKLWKTLVESMMKNYPCCCGTGTKEINYQSKGLIKGHAYTLLWVSEIEDYDSRVYQIVKIRNPWGKTEWQGKYSQKDKQFWDRIKSSNAKKILIEEGSVKNDGIFLMGFKDFCKYFQKIYICKIQSHSNFLTQPIDAFSKNASLYQIKIYKFGTYTFQLHQQNLRRQSQKRKAQGFCRSTLILSKQKEHGYQFINGNMDYDEEVSALTCQLQPGRYILYAKLDPSRITNKIPNKSSVSIYSVEFASIERVSNNLHKKFLQISFLTDAKHHVKETYNDNKMKICQRLLAKQGGFGYLVFSNKKDSNKKFHIEFKQQDFYSCNFKLKKPFKSQNSQTIQVKPGKQLIILARLLNKEVFKIQFPPPMKISLIDI